MIKQYLLLIALIVISRYAAAINVGNLTFSLPAEKTLIAKRVLNNNQEARLYQVNVTGIDRPGDKEVQIRPADGELLFTPRQWVLQPGQTELAKFYYHGPQDGRESYYRVMFREIPVSARAKQNSRGDMMRMDPVVTIETILVVRPRTVHFDWRWDKQRGTLQNVGNTYFKLLLKPGCDSTDEESPAFYLRPGETLRNSALRQKGQKYIVYNERFIRIDHDCID